MIKAAVGIGIRLSMNLPPVTKSIVLNQQMIGRGMRGPKMGGTVEFDLYTIADNLPGIDLAHTLMQDSWIQ